MKRRAGASRAECRRTNNAAINLSSVGRSDSALHSCWRTVVGDRRRRRRLLEAFLYYAIARFVDFSWATNRYALGSVLSRLGYRMRVSPAHTASSSRAQNSVASPRNRD